MPAPSISRIAHFLEGLMEVDEGMQIHTAVVLLRVASKPSIYMRELYRDGTLPRSTAARVVDRLSDRGLGLIYGRDDFEDRRVKVLTLTPEGQAVVKGLLKRF